MKLGAPFVALICLITSSAAWAAKGTTPIEGQASYSIGVNGVSYTKRQAVKEQTALAQIAAYADAEANCAKYTNGKISHGNPELEWYEGTCLVTDERFVSPDYPSWLTLTCGVAYYGNCVYDADSAE